MDTMHAAIDETGYHLIACCTPPPAGVNKPYLTEEALLVSAGAFADALTALNATERAGNGAETVAYRGRVERASMAILYTCMWRWDELRGFATNLSLAWPLPPTKDAAFEHFASIYNRTGTKQVANGAPKGAAPALAWLRQCVLDRCPGGGGSGPGQPEYAEVVLDSCSNATNPACYSASGWTAIPAATPNGTIFKNGLSLPEIPHHRYGKPPEIAGIWAKLRVPANLLRAETCYTLNVPPVEVDGSAQVVAYGDHTGKCSTGAIENTFLSAESGMLRMPPGYTTAGCSDKEGCCVQADAAGSLAMAACDSSNELQQFEVESLGVGAQGQIKDKKTGRCLQTKGCAKPQ